MAKRTVKLRTKLDTRGGRRVKRRVLSPYSLLIGAIWDKIGGPKLVSQAVGEHWQAPVNWRLRGAVPIEKIGAVAALLDIPLFGLNYPVCKKVFSDTPDWESVVKSYGLKKDVVEKILLDSKGVK